MYHSSAFVRRVSIVHSLNGSEFYRWCISTRSYCLLCRISPALQRLCHRLLQYTVLKQKSKNNHMLLRLKKVTRKTLLKRVNSHTYNGIDKKNHLFHFPYFQSEIHSGMNIGLMHINKWARFIRRKCVRTLININMAKEKLIKQSKRRKENGIFAYLMTYFRFYFQFHPE